MKANRTPELMPVVPSGPFQPARIHLPRVPFRTQPLEPGLVLNRTTKHHPRGEGGCVRNLPLADHTVIDAHLPGGDEGNAFGVFD